MSGKNSIIYSTRDGFSFEAQRGSITSTLGHFESCWRLSGDIGNGKIRRLKMCSGFDLWITDCFFREEVTVLSNDISPSFYLSFYLSGASMATVGLSGNTFQMKDGQQWICYLPGSGGTNRVGPNTKLCFIEIEIPIDRFFSYLEDDVNSLPPFMRKILERKSDDFFQKVRSITPDMQYTLNQIVYCPFHGTARRLFLESRTLELIADMFNQISMSCQPGAISNTMHPTDRKYTEIAKNILIKDLENPPGLKELAGSVGMSHPKLTRCFREMYGATVFQYLRNERLNRAREMLEREGLTVTETAYSVGYDSISHFSQAYKKNFGVSPRTRRGMG